LVLKFCRCRKIQKFFVENNEKIFTSGIAMKKSVFFSIKKYAPHIVSDYKKTEKLSI